jgi:hemoglobin-like flavoprotein
MEMKQIQMVKHSWSLVAPIADTAATIFYENLFTMDDELRHMFRGDLTEQKKKLVATLGFVIAKLDKLDDVVGEVKKLGSRHSGYGVKESHYHTVGAALLLTLEQGLGDQWNNDLKNAWVEAYTILSGAMIEAQRETEQGTHQSAN